MQNSPNCRLEGVSKRRLQHLHPSLWLDHAAKRLQGQPVTTFGPVLCLNVLSSPCTRTITPIFCSFTHPDKHHHPPPPNRINFFVRSISWWFHKFSQPSRKLETLSLVKGKHHGCPGEAAANSAPALLCKPAPGLHLCYYIQLALLQPRAMGYSLHPLPELSVCIQTVQSCPGCSWAPSRKTPDYTGHRCAGEMLRNNMHKCRTSTEANIWFSSIS